MEVQKDTQEVMDELRAEGYSFDGDEEKADDDNNAGEEADKKPEENKEKEDDDKEKVVPDEQGKKEEEKPVTERLPREPKKVKLQDGTETEAWRLKVKEKHEERQREQEEERMKNLISDVVKKEIGSLQLKDATSKEIHDEFKGISEKYELGVQGEEFLKDLESAILKKIPSKDTAPDDLREKLAKLEMERKKEIEDIEFDKSFSKEIIPKLKEINPDADDDSIEKAKEAFREYYFSERFLKLGASEIFAIKKDSFSDVIGKPVRPSEKGSKNGASRTSIVNYENMSEDEYAKLSDEEQQKVDEYLIRRQKGLV